MKKYLLALTFISFLSQAQTTQTIKGQVTDKESKYPLIGVIVSVIDVDPIIGSATDEDGNFKLTGVPIGRHTLKIAYVGYKEQSIPNVLVNSGKETVTNFQMEEQITQMDEVVVKAENDKTATNNDMAVVSARSFNPDDAMRYAGSRNDPSRMAMNYAGVSSGNDGRNDIIIRGNSPLGLLWRFEGIDIPNPNHFALQGTTGGSVSMLNANLLDKSDFMTSAFPANYGNATSGVFDLQMRRGNNEKREYIGQMGINGFELGAEGPFSKKSRASYMINYRYSTLELFKAIGVQFGTGAAVPKYQDLSFKFDLPTKKTGRFTLFGIGGLSYIELKDSDEIKLRLKDTTRQTSNFFGNNGRDGYFRGNTGVVGASHTYFINPTLSQKIILALSSTSNVYHQDTLNTKTGDKVRTEYANAFEQDKVSLNYSLNKKFNVKNSVNTGFNVDMINFSLMDSTIQGVPYGTWKKIRNNKGTDYLTRIWVQWQHKFSDRLILNLGVNYLNFSVNKNSNAFEPRLGIRYLLTEKMALNFGAGIHNQMQQIMIYYIKTPSYNNLGQVESYTEGNKNLGFTTSNHLVLGYDYNISKQWRVKAETYFQYLQHVPVTTFSSNYSIINDGSNFNFPGRDSLVNKGKGYNYGLELTIEKFFSKNFYLLGTASLFQSKYKGSDDVWRNTVYNGNYVFNALGGYEFRVGRKSIFTIDAKVTYSGGKRYTPINEAASVAAHKTVYYQDLAYTEQYKNYFRTDVKVSYRLETKKITHQWSIQLDNIFNTKNIFIQQYSPIDNKVITTNQLGLFIIPQYRVLF
jgi:hypothetical protein